MLKKITALFLITAFTHVYAATPIQQSSAIADELNRTYNELNYKLNVEWDQKDASFFNQSIDDFEKEISGLQQQGLSTKDLVQNALAKIKDKQVLNDVKELAKVVNESQMSPAEARAFVVSKLNSTYSHGASWSGHRGGCCEAGVLVGVIIICVLVYQYNHPKTEPEPTPVVLL